jgi:hypothetical protein
MDLEEVNNEISGQLVNNQAQLVECVDVLSEKKENYSDLDYSQTIVKNSKTSARLDNSEPNLTQI